jgi:hypothetical protein
MNKFQDDIPESIMYGFSIAKRVPDRRSVHTMFS